jgi:hypothetical protein
MVTMDDIERLVAGDHGLATISVARTDGSVHSSVVNAAVMDHPVSGERVVATVLGSASWKLPRLRKTRRATILFRVGWDWAAVDGTVDIIGPNDTADGFDPSQVPQLLRDVFTAAGGTHDDWDEYDRVVAADERAAVLLTPVRIQGRG